MFKRKVFHHYDIAFRKKGESKFTVINAPDYGWVADPFLVEYRNEIYLFAEIFLYKTERNGKIGYCKYENDHFSKWQISMDRHWHLSYPNVWVEEDTLFMCPESYQNGEVDIYKLISLPDNWIKYKTLINNVEYCDTTFLIDSDEKYAFTFERGKKSPAGRGLLYRFNHGENEYRFISDSLEGTRCGGKIFQHDGRYIRVGQNCVEEYGSGLIFYQIDSIWPDYKEHEVKRINIQDVEIINPYHDYTGIHTYNSSNGLEVIDLRYPSSTIEERIASSRVHKVFVNKYR